MDISADMPSEEFQDKFAKEMLRRLEAMDKAKEKLAEEEDEREERGA